MLLIRILVAKSHDAWYQLKVQARQDQLRFREFFVSAFYMWHLLLGMLFYSPACLLITAEKMVAFLAADLIICVAALVAVPAATVAS